MDKVLHYTFSVQQLHVHCAAHQVQDVAEANASHLHFSW